MIPMKPSEEIYHIPGRAVGALHAFDGRDHALLPLLGSRMDVNAARQIMAVQENVRRLHAMDAVTQPVTTPSISTPIQFLQKFAPGHVRVLTSARKGDEIVGVTTIGRWEDEEIVQSLLELLGATQPYGDYTNMPLSDWNNNWERRTIVRFQIGMEVKALEVARAAAMNIDSGAEKRNAATLQLEITRNQVTFYGYNNGANRTYGIFNDPGLPAYITAANGASGSPLWSTKTYLEICADIRAMVAQIVNNSQDVIDTERTPLTLVLPTVNKEFLGVTSQFGNSVEDWIEKTYKTMRITSAPQLNAANGGANVNYMFAETVDDGSTDDRRTWMQAIPTKFKVQGVQQEVNGYKESYTNATAGVMLKRPFALSRQTGV